MNNEAIRKELLSATAVASQYCITLENAAQLDKSEFISDILEYLPKIYIEFSAIDLDDLPTTDEYEYFPSYVDEEYYDSIRRGVESILGPDDIYLETFEEDMKYSDTPVSASISECLADIFQALYNYVSIVRESGGEQSVEAYRVCKEQFEEYWSQTLCNVMRALNHLKYNPTEE